MHTNVHIYTGAHMHAHRGKCTQTCVIYTGAHTHSLTVLLLPTAPEDLEKSMLTLYKGKNNTLF